MELHDAGTFIRQATRAFGRLRSRGFRLHSAEATSTGATTIWVRSRLGVQATWDKIDGYVDVRIVLLAEGEPPLESPVIYVPLSFLTQDQLTSTDYYWPAHAGTSHDSYVKLKHLAQALELGGASTLEGDLGSFERFANGQSGGMPGFDWWASLPGNRPLDSEPD